MPPYDLPESLQIVILAVIQGIAEFLPISSDGHLIAAESLMTGIADKTELNLVLHFGTLLSIIVVYWKRLIELLTHDKRLIPLLIVGTIPAAVIGLAIKRFWPELIEIPLLNGFMLVVMGMILLSLTKIKDGPIDYRDIGYVSAILIGVAQATALLPGISRSGTTIVAGCLLGLQRQSAATFSFLLAIPAISGACLLEGMEIYSAGGLQIDWFWGITGGVIAFAIGLLALRLLVRMLNQGSLYYFAYWLIPFGMANVVWHLYVMLRDRMGS